LGNKLFKFLNNKTPLITNPDKIAIFPITDFLDFSFSSSTSFSFLILPTMFSIPFNYGELNLFFNSFATPLEKYSALI